MTGAEFRRYRQLARLTQAGAAEIMGVSRTTVNRWEHDRQPIPKLASERIITVAARVQSA